MIQERPTQGKGVCWTLRLWSVAVIFMLFLSTCFIVRCLVTYQFTMDMPNRRLSELHANYSNLTCIIEGTMMSDRVWSCCPNDWKPFSSHCYFTLIDSKASWNESEEKCSQMGAHLLVIHSQEEQDFITRILDAPQSYFIGLSDPGYRQWQWVDQTPYNETSTFWHAGEPNNDYEQCVILNKRRRGWGWNDIVCSDEQNSVCQMKKIYF